MCPSPIRFALKDGQLWLGHQQALMVCLLYLSLPCYILACVSLCRCGRVWWTILPFPPTETPVSDGLPRLGVAWCGTLLPSCSLCSWYQMSLTLSQRLSRRYSQRSCTECHLNSSQRMDSGGSAPLHTLPVEPLAQVLRPILPYGQH